MREIKFRAWNTFNNKFEGGVQRIPVNIMVYFDLKGLDEDYIAESGTYFDEKTIIMQYTGLKDKNGKEAYHKDLISASGYSNWIIDWHKNGWYMKTTEIDEKHYHLIPDNFIIIGNFYENLELLKNK